MADKESQLIYEAYATQASNGVYIALLSINGNTKTPIKFRDTATLNVYLQNLLKEEFDSTDNPFEYADLFNDKMAGSSILLDVYKETDLTDLTK